MNQGEFSNYLLFVALALGILGVVNLLRPNKRWLGGASLLWGVAALLYRTNAPTWAVAICGASAVFGMGMDVSVRQRSKA